MASPPPSDIETNLGEQGPSDKVSLLVSEARLTTDLTPALATVMLTHKQLILDVLGRQIQLIRSRPQSLALGHVTVYDKALLTLTSTGNDLENPSALLFWCQHFLSIDNVRAPSDTPKFLQEMMAVPTVFNQAIETFSLHRLSGTTIKSEPDESPEPVIFSSQATEPKLKRLFTIYDQARTEYLAVADSEDAKAIKAAKFLRDTAENALSMLKDANVDANVLMELTTTCNKAKEAVVTLSGGKKRKFDCPGGEHVNDTGSKRNRELRNGGNNGRGGERGRGHSGVPYGYTRHVDSYQPY